MTRTKRRKLFIVCLCVLAAVCVRLQADGTDVDHGVYELEETVITATRVETPRHQVAANITVITRQDVENTPAASVAELLQYVPGVYVEFNGGLGSQATARIEGSEVRHVAVYQDGVPLNQLANPLTDLSYVSVDAIERIEIYKGAASAAWGSSLGGVINIITRDPHPGKAARPDVRISYGDFGTLRSRASLSGTMGRLGYLLSLTHDESDGFVAYTAHQQDAVYAKLDYGLSKRSRLSLVYSYDEGRNQDPVPNALDFLDEDFWDDIYRERTYQRLLFEASPSDDVIFSLEGRYHRFYNRIEDVFPDRRETFSDYRDRVYGLSARISWNTSAANTLNLGFDEDWGWYDWENYDREYETRNGALYANDTLTLGGLSLNLGLRYDDNRDFGTEISPSAGAVYRTLGGKALIRGQVARGFSAPPAAWVHDPWFGDPALEPEIGVVYQLGGRARPFSCLELELTLFRSDVEDQIRFNYNRQKFENIDRVTRKGVQGGIRAAFDTGLVLTLGGSYTDVRDDATDRVIEDIPRKTYNAMVSYSNEWITHSLLGRYIDHNSSFPETRDRLFVFDYLVRVGLPLPENYGKLKLYGAVYNLTDAAYLYREVWPQPGRRFEAGISLEY